MKWGKKLETIIAQTYAEETGNEIQALPEGEVIERDGWRGGTPDRLVLNRPLILEVKTAGIRSAHHWGETGTDQIPEYYLPQVAWYLSLFPHIEGADVAVLIGGNDFRIYHVKRNPSFEKRLIEIGNRFWRDHVLADVPPQIDGTESSARYLAETYPKHTTDLLEPSTGETDQLACELAEIKEDMKILSDREAMIESLFKSRIGDKAGFAGNGWKCTWKKALDSVKTDWKAVSIDAKASEEVIARHSSVVVGSRRFVFKHN